MQQRYYDPVVGRFYSNDPVGFTGEPETFNRYSYANNNPYKYTDPDGRFPALARMMIAPPVAPTSSSLPNIPGHPGVPSGSGSSPTVPNIPINASSPMGSLVTGIVLNAVRGAESPDIKPSDVAGKTPEEIDKIATGSGLIPKGPDPQNGKGAYVDPITDKQRVLIHPDASCGAHCHVNDANGNRLDINGNVVAPESPEAHLPIDTKQE